ncbi:transient receptor potential cation channel subfamily A member 1-like isoform X3 [Xenia sp. Carnegie-2017]|nr:transient receptor potential cation channel subfamily A member 1-like isoform X3 [Xenia sp. Carnegie-2017]
MLLICGKLTNVRKFADTHLIEFAMHRDLECFKFLLNLFEDLKKTFKVLQRSNKLDNNEYDSLLVYPFRIGQERQNLLHAMRFATDPLKILVLLSKCSVFNNLINAKDDKKRTPLMKNIYSYCCNIDIPMKMVECGAYIDSIDCNNTSPLYQAVTTGNIQLVQKMTSVGKVETNDSEVLLRTSLYCNKSVFYPAVKSCNLEMLKWLYNKVSNSFGVLLKELKENIDELEIVIVNNNLVGILGFLVRIANESTEGIKLRKVLCSICFSAVVLNKIDLVKTFFDVKYAKKVFSWCASGRNVFFYAVENYAMLERLLVAAKEKLDHKKIPKILDETDNTNCSVLHFAALANQGEAFSTLVKFGVEFHPDRDMQVPINYILACLEGLPRENEHVLPIIREAVKLYCGTIFSAKSEYVHDCLMHLVENGMVDIVKYLMELDLPIDLKKRDRNGNTLLHAATSSNSLAMVNLLLDIEPGLLIIANDESKTPIVNAVFSTNVDVLKILLEHKSVLFGVKDLVHLLMCAKEKTTFTNSIVDFAFKYYGSTGLVRILSEITSSDGRLLSQFNEESVAHILDKYINYPEYDFSLFKSAENNVPDFEFFMKNRKYEKIFGHPLVEAFIQTTLQSNSAKTAYYFLASVNLIFFLLLTTFVGLFLQGVRDMKSPGMITLASIIFLFCVINLAKEVLQICNDRKLYFLRDGIRNAMELALYICTIIFVLPLHRFKYTYQIGAGGISVFLAWINFIWFLKNAPVFGTYVILIKRVFQSLLKIFPVVCLLVGAFSMTFMLLKMDDEAFRSLPLSAMTTLIMMNGEIEYREQFMRSNSSLFIMQSALLLIFFLVMGVVVMNVFIGLAVGDTDEMMKRSRIEKYLHKARMFIEFNKTLAKLPRLLRPEQTTKAKFVKPFKGQKIFDENGMETKMNDLISETTNLKNNAKNLRNNVLDAQSNVKKLENIVMDVKSDVKCMHNEIQELKDKIVLLTTILAGNKQSQG